MFENLKWMCLGMLMKCVRGECRGYPISPARRGYILYFTYNNISFQIFFVTNVSQYFNDLYMINGVILFQVATSYDKMILQIKRVQTIDYAFK